MKKVKYRSVVRFMDFLRRFVSVGETRVHHYTPESKQWMLKTKTVLPAGKVIATVFYESEEIILIDFLEKDKKNNRGVLYILTR